MTPYSTVPIVKIGLTIAVLEYYSTVAIVTFQSKITETFTLIEFQEKKG